MRNPSAEQPESGHLRRVHVFVSGQVQGVGYRAFAIRSAARRRLMGTVRNLRDGRVEVIAEGASSPLAELLADLREGPWGAHVEDLEVAWSEASGEYSSFGVSFASDRAFGGYR